MARYISGSVTRYDEGARWVTRHGESGDIIVNASYSSILRLVYHIEFIYYNIRFL